MTPANTQDRLFRIVVRRLHWLSRVPLAPELFDAFLLAWTALFHRQTLRAIGTLESEVLQIPGIAPVTHRFGGLGFTSEGREFAHVHGNGLLDVKMSCEQAAELVAEGRALPHHVFGPSAWISFWIRTPDDCGPAVALIEESLTLPR
ncbi:MAG: luciferase family protein [Chthoniobacteraceae bacterium]